jgi:hypothetical protein
MVRDRHVVVVVVEDAERANEDSTCLLGVAVQWLSRGFVIRPEKARGTCWS